MCPPADVPPPPIDALFARARAAHAQGRAAEAVALYREALALGVPSAGLLNNLALALLDEGQAAQALDCCDEALALSPGLAPIHCNRAGALMQLGRLDEADAAFGEALRLQPQMRAAHAGLAELRVRQGRDAEALDGFHRALELGADSPALFAGLALAWQRLGRPAHAVACWAEALQRADAPAFRDGFVQAIRTLAFGSPEPALRALLLRALEEGWADPGELLTPATSLVEAEPALMRGDPQALAADALLRALLLRDTLNSVPMERLLVRQRQRLLHEALAGTPIAPGRLAFFAALAFQCFLNEYVYPRSEEDAAALARLRADLDEAASAGREPSAAALVAWAAHAPLGELAGAQAWARAHRSPPLDLLFRQQVLEPARERELRATIPVLTPIADEVSQRVRAQYEAHPYPRWTVAPRADGVADPQAWLARQFPGAPLQRTGRGAVLDVLVAGCGTGQHAVRVARQFPGARVLAVDLSLASLAYARRQSEAAGHAAIEYAQADLLALGGIGRRFDLVEAAGVLHHLADPLAGWRVLQSLLRPGGLMHLGLYSEAARRELTAARERLLAARGGVLPSTDDEIRHGRQALLEEAEATGRRPAFLHSRDFHATSACRDLLFHVQEHRFTLPRLKAAIEASGMALVGLAVEPAVAAAYVRRFPEDPARRDLDRWHVFEAEHPDTFAGMYGLWLQAR